MERQLISELLAQLELHVSQLRSIQNFIVDKGDEFPIKGISDSIILIGQTKDYLHDTANECESDLFLTN